MASRREQRDAARRARLAAEQEAAARLARQRRVMSVVGLAIVGVVVVGVVVAIVVGGSRSGGIPKTKRQRAAVYRTVAAELAGIPQHGTTLGNLNAKVTMTYYGDLQCPVCAAFTLGRDGGGLPQFIAGPVRAGRVKIVYRSLCTATECPANQSTFSDQQVAAYAAGRQHLFWNYAELFYREQEEEDSGYVTNTFLTGLARQIPGLDETTWNQDRKDPDLIAQVQADATAAARDKLQGTPSVIMAGPKHEEQVSPGSIPSYDALRAAVSDVS